MNIHRQARTTPKIREEIRASKDQMTLDQAAKHFNVSRSTILKWRNRESVEDRSHCPGQIHTALTPIQEEIVVLIRRSLLLTVDDLQKRYLLVAIDRATRWVYLKVIHDKGAKTTAAFIQCLHENCPVNIKIILTDNGKEFTDRFTANGEREPTGNHAFDKACAGLSIEHRLIPPKHPQTNGMVERFNGRISHLVKTTYFANAEEMTTTLGHYVKLYNQHIVQRNLGHSTPVQTLKEWYRKKPELFKKRVYIRPLAKVGILPYKVMNELPNPEDPIPHGVQTRSRNPPAALSRTA